MLLRLFFFNQTIAIFFSLFFFKAYSMPQIQEKYFYDDQENRVAKENGDLFTYYIDHYEENYSNNILQNTKSYYFANGKRLVSIFKSKTNLTEQNKNKLKYFYSDMLGSATRVANQKGNHTKSIFYSPYGSEN